MNLSKIKRILKKRVPKPTEKLGKSITNEELDKMLKEMTAKQVLAKHTHNIINLKARQLDRVLALKNA